MVKDKMMDFCTQCREDRTYTLRKKTIKKEIRNKIYEFEITVAECDECGAEMDIPGLLDFNMKAIDEQYRLAEGIVSIEDINKIMAIYNIGKAPLSIALGFEENTITRYLAGQIPSKEHSDVIKKLVNKYRNNNEKIF